MSRLISPEALALLFIFSVTTYVLAQDATPSRGAVQHAMPPGGYIGTAATVTACPQGGQTGQATTCPVLAKN